MAKHGMFSWFSYPLPIEERLQLIKQIGFDATSLWWAEENKHIQPDMARKLELQIDNIHTPFENANDIWIDTPGGEEYQNMLIGCVNECAQHGISVAVVHITGFSNPPEVTQNRFRSR